MNIEIWDTVIIMRELGFVLKKAIDQHEKMQYNKKRSFPYNFGILQTSLQFYLEIAIARAKTRNTREVISIGLVTVVEEKSEPKIVETRNWKFRTPK